MSMGAQSARDDGALVPIPIANEVLRDIIPRKCLHPEEMPALFDAQSILPSGLL
jgi:hypothetical protein